MTPDISDALVSGDGRLTRLFITIGRAFVRRPFALMLTGLLSFMPMLLYIVKPFGSQLTYAVSGGSSAFQIWSLLPPPATFIIFTLLCLCFAWSAGPLCSLTYQAIYPTKPPVPLTKSLRAVVPMFLLWLTIFFCILLWVIIAEISDRYLPSQLYYVGYIWLALLLALLASMPAFLSLFAPVFTLETGTWREKWRRMMSLGAGYRWRSIGYSMACGLAGFIVAFALSTGLVAILPTSLRFQLDDWIYLANFGVFWMAMCMMATVLYARIRVARGELDPEDVATVFD